LAEGNLRADWQSARRRLATAAQDTILPHLPNEVTWLFLDSVLFPDKPQLKHRSASGSERLERGTQLHFPELALELDERMATRRSGPKLLNVHSQCGSSSVPDGVGTSTGRSTTS
jgi:hypothetical protein